MKITKFGHCCLLIEENGVRILTDPGVFSTQQNEVKNIDFILITHEHADHYHIESIKAVLKNNPQAKIITNKSVGALLEKENISFEIVEHGEQADANGILLEGFGEQHALIYRAFPQVQNTGYFIAGKLFYPGDAFTNPGKQMEILALPVAGPWLKFSEVVDYALELKPKIIFPVHDGILKSADFIYAMTEKSLESGGIKFMPLEIDKETEI